MRGLFNSTRKKFSWSKRVDSQLFELENTNLRDELENSEERTAVCSIESHDENPWERNVRLLRMVKVEESERVTFEQVIEWLENVTVARVNENTVVYEPPQILEKPPEPERWAHALTSSPKSTGASKLGSKRSIPQAPRTRRGSHSTTPCRVRLSRNMRSAYKPREDCDATYEPEPPALGLSSDNVFTFDMFSDWSLDVFEIAPSLSGNMLPALMAAVMERYAFAERLSISARRLYYFLHAVEQRYCYTPHAPNPYHTALHAADVFGSVVYIINHVCNESLATRDIFTLYIAALIHDFRHPGVNQGFLTKTSHELALLYNDSSVLENFHVSESFRLMRSSSDMNFLVTASEADRTHFRKVVIQLTLATDLAKHAQVLSAFTQKFLQKSAHETTEEISNRVPCAEDEEGNILVLQMALKCADISHPTKKWSVHHRWSLLIVEEFFNQGDAEKLAGLPVSALCDRQNDQIHNMQIGFIDFVVRPCFSAVIAYFSKEPNLEHAWLQQLNTNRRQWVDGYDETSADKNHA